MGIVCLDNLISDLRGGAPLESEDFRQEGFPVLHKGAIKPFGEIEIDSKKKTFTHQNFVDKHPKSIISKQHVAVILRDLIPSGASIGLMSYLKSSPYSYYILAQGAYGFLVDEKRVCPEYLVLLSNTAPYRKFIRSIAVGSTQIHVRTPIFTEIYIPLPPIAEQKRIAVIAQKCDRLRRTRRYIQQLSDGYLRSVFLEMFGNPSTNSMGWEILDLESQLKKLRAVGVQFQEKFAQIVQRFERLRIQQREGDRQAEHLFQTVLHRAFRGEL